MNIKFLHMVEGAKEAKGIAVIIDVFRAFTVEAYLMNNGVKKLMPVGDMQIAYDYKEKDSNAVVLNAATPTGLGMFKGVREKYAQRGQFVDVGIAEENAMAMASGVSRNGGTAVFGTFFYKELMINYHMICV